MARYDLIVARYEEDLSWLLEVPSGWRIILYNKGSLIGDRRLLERIDLIEARPNVGRESESYFTHIASGRSADSDWVVFAQGDPFPHSPDFLALLDTRHRWREEVQPLSVRWLEERGVPPELVIRREKQDWIGGLRVRREWFSLGNWGPLSFCDDGAVRILREYLQIHGLREGTNLAQHFLRLASWEDLAGRAGAADLGRFCYGAIFAVEGRRLSVIPDSVLGQMRELALSHPIHGYMFERLWLHFFGEPFVAVADGTVDVQ